MATKKIRVYELARELGVENQVVLDLCERLKIGVKSHSSSIDDPLADRVRRLADSEGLRQEPVVEELPEPMPAPAKRPAARPTSPIESPVEPIAEPALIEVTSPPLPTEGRAAEEVL
ncbi:MAG TPA: translation initiation factor IF-2 N-terminal domain-containing protein, partial [Acidimicrobiia bacterium]